MDQNNATSDWTSSRSFQYAVTPVIPNPPSNLAPSSGGTITNNKPALTFDLSTSQNGDKLRYWIEVYDAPLNFSKNTWVSTGNPVIIYYQTDADVPGTRTFTVGQAETGGYYINGYGHSGQSLPDGTYYWLVYDLNQLDTWSAEASDATAAANGGPAFIVTAAIPEFSTWIGILTVLAGFGLVYKFMPKFGPGLTKQ